MLLIESIDSKVNMPKGTVVTIGAFDGVHAGHKEILNRVKDYKLTHSLNSLIYTFRNNPKSIDGQGINQIVTSSEKLQLLSEYKPDYIVMPLFDIFHKNIEYNVFLKEILIEKFRMVHLVVGHDFRFGKGGEGNIKTIAAASRKLGFSYEIIPEYIVDNHRVSSTLIRDLLLVGDVKEVSKFLGRNHYYKGKVTYGKRLGGKLGFPTANLVVDESMDSLKPGVYITKVLYKGIYHSAVTNIGYNPTFTNTGLNLETHILDFNENIYEKEIKVEFIDRIRDELKFNSIDDLLKYVNMDINIAREYFSEINDLQG